MAAIACCTLEGEYNRFGELTLLDLNSGEIQLLDGHFLPVNNDKGSQPALRNNSNNNNNWSFSPLELGIFPSLLHSF